MATLDEKKAQRWRYLKALYELMNGRAAPVAGAAEDEIAAASGLSEDEADAVREYLKNEGLIAFTSMGHFGLTHRGIKEYERATSHPERPTHYFPPIINIGNLTNSQVQIGSHGSSQVQHITQGLDGAALATLVREIRAAELPAPAQVQLDGILKVLEQPKQPEASIVKALLGSAKSIVEGAGGTLLAEKIAGFLSGL